MDEDDVKTSFEVSNEESDIDSLHEEKILEQVQRRTFSHYPHYPEFIKRMIRARFYYCNLNDRVVCLECGLICEEWKPGVDDPVEVHRMISPNCRCVQSEPMSPRAPSPLPASPIPIINADLSQIANVPARSAFLALVNKLSHHDKIVLLKPCHSEYAELSAREKSFDNWPDHNTTAVIDLVQAGFCYTGKENVVTCFYCDGSLGGWGANDNPMIEHARWFPNCAYARQLCGDELYQQIQEAQRLRQGFLKMLHFLSCSLFIFSV